MREVSGNFEEKKMKEQWKTEEVQNVMRDTFERLKAVGEGKSDDWKMGMARAFLELSLTFLKGGKAVYEKDVSDD